MQSWHVVADEQTSQKGEQVFDKHTLFTRL